MFTCSSRRFVNFPVCLSKQQFVSCKFFIFSWLLVMFDILNNVFWTKIYLYIYNLYKYYMYITGNSNWLLSQNYCCQVELGLRHLGQPFGFSDEPKGWPRPLVDFTWDSGMPPSFVFWRGSPVTVSSSEIRHFDFWKLFLKFLSRYGKEKEQKINYCLGGIPS